MADFTSIEDLRASRQARQQESINIGAQVLSRFVELERFEPVRTELNGERTYDTIEGAKRSVTTILSGTRDKTSLQIWREEIGEENADLRVKLAVSRGNHTHDAIHNWITKGEQPRYSIFYTPYWKSALKFLQRVVKIILSEGTVWHPDGFAGSLDGLGYLDDSHEFLPDIFDYKTADKWDEDSIYTKIKLYDYKLQVSAYWKATEHVYRHLNLRINRAFIIIFMPDCKPIIYEITRFEMEQFYQQFLARVHRFSFVNNPRRLAKRRP
jgi:hypothetical protein